ncbi:CDP-alcohol phosphatidyltransferase family protein [Pontibacter ruber]|uniref:CDP-alcohol phosphatidyltransferase family protein n=1 Tax=Pontibacter ruber TaxID=1343895 RepID=A0ABW5D0U9_9BACT|nr:CDP-alcohol phosphatidyltransferase family protein [Pontibacter ruber]
MNRWTFYLINGITFYRLLAAFILSYLLLNKNLDVFKWLLPLSFFTDAIDGYLARRYNAVSILGSKLDSVADQLTLVAAVAGLFVFRTGFIQDNAPIIAFVIALYAGQTIMALLRYRRISSFHTYLAKIASVLVAAFLVLIFLVPQPVYTLFYLTALVISMELLEEMMLVLVLPEWKADVKGLYWVLQCKRKKHSKV